MIRDRVIRNAAAMAIVAAALACACASARAGSRNLLANGDFRRGSGATCDGWRTDAWILDPTATTYAWIAPQNGEPAELEIDTRRDNDARWLQTVPLGPGWYYASVEARTEDASQYFTGATISAMEDGIMSPDLRETTDWRRIGFYLKIGPHGADVDFALRLGGYMNLTRGKAFFRAARIERIAAPPPGATPIYDLDAIRRAEVTGPIGHAWSLVATFMGFALMGVWGWNIFRRTIPTRAEASRRPWRANRRRV